MSAPTTVPSDGPHRLQFTLRDILWATTVCAAALSLVGFRRLYWHIDPIPFTWTALPWYKATVVIPWAIMGAAFIRYRLIGAIIVHHWLVVLWLLRCALLFAFGQDGRDPLVFAYDAMSYDTQLFLLAAVFSFPCAVVGVGSRSVIGWRKAAASPPTCVQRHGPKSSRSVFALEELSTVVSIIVQMFCLLQPAVRGWVPVSPLGVERWVAQRELKPEEEVQPAKDLLVDGFPIEGRWRYPSFTSHAGWIDIVRLPEDNVYWVGLGAWTSYGPAIAKRTATLHEGVLTLDRPAPDFRHRTIFTKLYLIRRANQDLLLPSCNTKLFQDDPDAMTSTPGRQHLHWLVFARAEKEP